MKTTVTFRTDEELKNQAITVFESIGMTLTTALNMFMKQAVLKQKYPCSLDLETTSALSTAWYPKSFLELFGAGNDLGFDEEPEDLPPEEEFT